MRRLIRSAKLGAILAFVLLSVFSLQAAPIDCMGAFPCAIGGSWIAFTTPNGNNVNLRNINLIEDNDDNSYNFTLEKVVTFNNLNPVTIEFFGPAVPASRSRPFLR